METRQSAHVPFNSSGLCFELSEVHLFKSAARALSNVTFFFSLMGKSFVNKKSAICAKSSRLEADLPLILVYKPSDGIALGVYIIPL